MTTQIRAFRPLADTQNVVVTGTAQTLTFNYQIGTNAMRVCNIGTQTVFVVINDATSNKTATVAIGMPIPAGNTEVFTVGNGNQTMSIIAAGTGSTLYVTQGEGL